MPSLEIAQFHEIFGLQHTSARESITLPRKGNAPRQLTPYQTSLLQIEKRLFIYDIFLKQILISCETVSNRRELTS